MIRSPASNWPRREVLQAVLPLLVFGYAGFARATTLNTLERLDLPTPNTGIEDPSGGMTALGAFRPTPLLVNFWASWCPPCIRELPALEVLDKALAEDGMGVLLVGIDRKDRGFGEAFLEERGIEVARRAYDAKGDLFRAMGVRAMPTSFLLSGNGVIIGKVEGELEWGSPETISAVRSILMPS